MYDVCIGVAIVFWMSVIGQVCVGVCECGGDYMMGEVSVCGVLIWCVGFVHGGYVCGVNVWWVSECVFI